MTRINVKRIYDAIDQNDGFRVLVDRLWPRGIKKEKAALGLWAKEIAPSDELRHWFNHDAEKWMEFQKRYHKELAAKPEVLDNFLRTIAKNKTVTFLFAAKETEHNNAVALRNGILKKWSAS